MAVNFGTQENDYGNGAKMLPLLKKEQWKQKTTK